MASKVSIVLPCYNECGNIEPMLKALLDVGLQASYDLEIIFVDDGSSDGTWATIQEAAGACTHVKGVRLSRNFGQQAAILAGLRAARGDVVATMDSDLQHPPSLLPGMLDAWKKGAEIVTTIRQFGRERFFKRVSSDFFYKGFRLLTGLPIVPGQADYRLFDRRVVDAILGFRESGMFLRGLVSWIGFRGEQISYTADARHSGETKYTLRKMVMLAIEGMFSFSYVPLRLGFVLGFFLEALAVLWGLYALVVRLVSAGGSSRLVTTWGSLAALLGFFFGLLFIYLGLLGEYLARVYIESKGRPLYIVADTTGAGLITEKQPLT